jgi:hypothetical protein
MDMKTPGASYLRLRYAIALAMSTAPFVALDRAEAACDPATSSANPVINTAVNCTGTTTDQNGTTGYGVKQDKGNTINVQAGASVNGTNLGIEINGVSSANPDTINNSGTISGASGIHGSFGIVNNHAGATISGSGANGIGIEILAQGVVTNSGSISGVREGIFLQNGEVTNTETGTIFGGMTVLRLLTWSRYPTQARSRAEYVASTLAPPRASTMLKFPAAASSREA